MAIPFTYSTLDGQAEGSFHDSGSKFLSHAFPADNRVVIDQKLSELKSQHPRARHLCYAFRIIDREEILEYSSDAGEPPGSAGQPILGELRRRDLVNTALVVVRYFGGTKLGIPGLIHAYRESARLAIENGTRVSNTRKVLFEVDMPLALQPKFFAACKQYDIILEQPGYSARFSARIKIPMENADVLLNQLLARTGGREGKTEEICKWLDIRVKTYSSD